MDFWRGERPEHGPGIAAAARGRNLRDSAAIVAFAVGIAARSGYLPPCGGGIGGLRPPFLKERDAKHRYVARPAREPGGGDKACRIKQTPRSPSLPLKGGGSRTRLAREPINRIRSHHHFIGHVAWNRSWLSLRM